jgi:hypothetical protein
MPRAWARVMIAALLHRLVNRHPEVQHVVPLARGDHQDDLSAL